MAQRFSPLTGETIALREWDFNYNGAVFNKDPVFDNQVSFTRSLGAAGTYQVALRVTTNQQACSSLLIIPVQVDPLPNASFTPSIASGCGPLTVIFTNNSFAGQPDVIDRFVWEIDARGGLGFNIAGTQRPTDPGFTATFTNRFTNLTTINKLYDIRLRVITVNNCESMAASQIITVFPGTISGFNELNYSPFSSNCSPQSVNFRADSQTQSLGPVDYLWSVSDTNGLIAQESTGTTPTFNFVFSNLTSSSKDFRVTLTSRLSSGCQGDSTRTIRISPVPNSLFVIDTLQFDCEVMRLKATAIQNGLSSYHWVINENGIPVINSTSLSGEIERVFSRASSNTADVMAEFSLDTRNLLIASA